MKFFNFWSPCPTNLVKIDPVLLEKKMLTHDKGRQPIEIDHPSYSGDLKTEYLVMTKYICKGLTKIFSISSPIQTNLVCSKNDQGRVY